MALSTSPAHSLLTAVAVPRTPRASPIPSSCASARGSRAQPRAAVEASRRQPREAGSQGSSVGRRQALSSLLAAAAASAFAGGEPVLAEPDVLASDTPASAADAENPLIQRLLERSKANKEKYDKQRLDDYYRRNFKDYMEFLGGSLERRKDLSENDKAILEWRKNNS